jgi:ribosome-associated toxin RatA of RatAB toxin-antitoxin module
VNLQKNFVKALSRRWLIVVMAQSLNLSPFAASLANNAADCSKSKVESAGQNQAAGATVGDSSQSGKKKQEQISPSSPPVVSEERQGNKTYAVGSVVVNARPERIWQLLTDYNNAPDIFNNLQKCEIVQDNGSNKLVKQLVHPKGTPLKFEYVMAIKETAPVLMEWHRKSGSFKDVSGSWKLEPDGDSGMTKVTYSIFIDGGLLLPPWLLRGQSKSYLPDLLLSLKQASERKQTTATTAQRSNRG